MAGKFRKWWGDIKVKIFTGVTVALTVIGVLVVGFDSKSGQYFLVQYTGDTLFFSDSIDFVRVTDSLYDIYLDKDSTSIYLCINKDGRLVDYIDPFTTHTERGDHYLRNTTPAFRYYLVPRADLVFWRNALSDTLDTKRLDFNDIIAATGEDDFAAEFQSKVRMVQWPDIDLKTMLKLKGDVNNPPIVDRLTVSIGDSTVGSGGKYATFAAAFTDIDNPGGLTGDLTFTLISHVTETALALMTETFNGNTFTLRSTKPHNGSPIDGWLISWNHDNFLLHVNPSTDGGNFEAKDLNIFSQFDVTALYSALRVDDVDTARIHDILIDGNGRDDAFGLNLDFPTGVFLVWNVVVWDLDRGVFVADVGTASRIENVTAYSCRLGIDVNSENLTLKNNYVTNSTTADFSLVGNATGNNNASLDTTAQDANWNSSSGNVTSIVLTDEVVDSVETVAEFFRLKTGGSLDSGGTTASIPGNTDGNRKYGLSTSRDGATPSIGADEYKPFITAGKMTIGVGGTYDDFNEALGDLDSLTANCTLEVIGNVSEIQKVAFSTEDITGSNLVITGDAGFTGIPSTTADTITLATDIDLFDLAGISNNAGDTLQITKLFCVGAAPGTNQYFTRMMSVPGATMTTLISNNLIKGGGSGQKFHGIRSNKNDFDCRIWNNIIWNCSKGIWDMFNGDTLENNTVYNCDIGFNFDDKTSYSANNAVFSSASFDFAFSGATDPIGNNNASSDVTSANFPNGTNNSISKTLLTEFTSATETAVGFFVPLTTADTVDVGGIATSIAENTEGLQTNARPGADGFVSMGAVEFLLLCTPTFDTTFRDTTLDSTCLSTDTLQVFISDSMQVDSICGDTTLNYIVSARDSIVVDTTPPVIDTVIVLCDSIQLTISSCASGDTTDRDTFFVSPPVLDSTFRDTTLDSTCLSLDTLQIFYSDSLQIDSIKCTDTTLNYKVIARDSFRIDTILPVIDTIVAFCDSIQLTISSCASGDTTNRDTFFVSPSTFDTTFRDTTLDSTCLSLDTLQIFFSDSQQVDSIKCLDTTLNYIVNARDSFRIDTILPIIDTIVASCDSIQLTISSCVSGDTTNRDTFFVSPSTFDTTFRDTTLDSACLILDTLLIFYSDSQQIDSIKCLDTTLNYIVNPRDTFQIDTILPTTFDTLGLDSALIDTIVFQSDTLASFDDTVGTDTVTTITTSGDTTFIDSLSRLETRVCSIKVDSLHERFHRDSIRFTLSACVGNDTTGIDTIAADTVTGPTITPPTLDSLCTAATFDSTLYASDTIIVSIEGRLQFDKTMFINNGKIGFEQPAFRKSHGEDSDIWGEE